MATTTVDVRELPNRFAEILSLAASGTEVILTDGNVARARLLSLAPGRARVEGMHPGAMTASPDFDAPLPEEFWTGSQ